MIQNNLPVRPPSTSRSTQTPSQVSPEHGQQQTVPVPGPQASLQMHPILSADDLRMLGPVCSVRCGRLGAHDGQIVLCRDGVLLFDALWRLRAKPMKLEGPACREFVLVDGHLLLFRFQTPPVLVRYADNSELEVIASATSSFPGKILSGCWNATAAAVQECRGLIYYLTPENRSSASSKITNTLAVCKVVQSDDGNTVISEGVFSFAKVEDFAILDNQVALILTSEGRLQKHEIYITEVYEHKAGRIGQPLQHKSHKLEAYSNQTLCYDLRSQQDLSVWSKLLVTKRYVVVVGSCLRKLVTSFSLFCIDKLQILDSKVNLHSKSSTPSPVSHMALVKVNQQEFILAGQTSGELTLIGLNRHVQKLEVLASFGGLPQAGNCYFGLLGDPSTHNLGLPTKILSWGHTFMAEISLHLSL